MIHVISNIDPVIVAHLQDLVDYFERRGIAHVVRVSDEPLAPEEIIPGDVYLSCNLQLDRWLEHALDEVFLVQLAHNLTFLKGLPFHLSTANLNVLPSLNAVPAEIRGDGSRFVVGGYPRWDRIFAERFLIDRRRAEVAVAHGLDPSLPWVVFYPTGPNREFGGNAHRTMDLYRRVVDGLGSCEFVFCRHAHTPPPTVELLRAEAERDRNLHLLDGAESLPFITACDLFITDIASTVFTAISMDKPVLYLDIEHRPALENTVKAFQAGHSVRDVGDLRRFISEYRTPTALKELFLRCLAFDDDRNCERITGIVLDRYATWQGQ